MDEGAARRREFLAQAEELTDALFADLQALRAAAAGTGRARRALLDRLFRHAHTLKGSAGLLDEAEAPRPPQPAPDTPRPNPVARLAHELEDLLDAARARRVPLGADALDACEDAADALSLALDAAARGEAMPDPPPALVERLRRLARGAQAVDSAGAPPEPASDESKESASEESKESASEESNDAAGLPIRPPSDSTSGEPADPTPGEFADGPRRASSGRGAAAREREHAAGRLPAEIAAALGAAERARVAEAAGEGARIVSVEVRFGLAEVDEKFNRLSAALEGPCETLATLPGPQADDPGQISLLLVCATHEGAGEIARRLAQFGARVRSLSEPAAAGETTDAAVESSAGGDAIESTAVNDGFKPTVAKDAVKSSADGEAFELSADDEAFESSSADAVEQPSSAVAADTVRVPLAELDELVFAADELFDETLTALGAGPAARLRQKFLALSERVLALRMQTLARPLERASRAARVAARASGKLVEIEVAGGAARLDRTVAERIAEPLAHLVRNAVAHGVESPAERRAAGKDERGRVRLAAVTEGARVRVSVSDDGRGIDLEGVARAARAQGIVREGAQVSEAQALRLIFRPGFSTAGRVSETAGRGVGLDAVEHEIELAGGEVRVRTLAGRGTTFELHLPLALALVPVILVRACGQTYALDADQIAETGRLEPAALAFAPQPADSGPRIDPAPQTGAGPRSRARWRGRSLPFARLDALLKLPGGEGSRDDAATRAGGVPVVVVVRAGAHGDASASQFVVAVDEVLGRRDALVRSLGRHATRWRGTSGAIDLRDGAAALMLDLPRLLEDHEP